MVKFEHVSSAPVAISKVFRVIWAITNQLREVIHIFLRNTVQDFSILDNKGHSLFLRTLLQVLRILHCIRQN